MVDQAENTERKQRGRPFTRGTSGNPSGRPRGSKHKALLALDTIGQEGAEAALRVVVQAARTGDMRAAEILLRRCWPERKGRPVALALPDTSTPEGINRGVAAVIAAVGSGTLSPEEAAAVASVLETQRKTIELTEVETRVRKLEQAIARGI